jgi:diguanylate cyclase (GGDEF)-like protein/PAS domain S-box-containing protein
MNDKDIALDFMDSVPMPLAVVTEEGHTVAVNRAFRAAWPDLGSKPSILDVIDIGDRQRVLTMVHSVIEERAQPEDLFLDVTRELRHVQVTMSLLPPTLVERPAVLLLFRELDQQSPAVCDLAYRESRWNHALISSELGVWDHNWGKGRKYYSPTWYKMRGLRRSDPLPHSTAEWLQNVHPHDRAKVVVAMERQAAGDPAFAVFDYREQHKDGHWVWIESRGAGVEWDAEGRPTRVVGTDTDVTGRKAAEEAASRSARRLEMALDISGIGVFDANFTTGHSEWDERMFGIYGMHGNSTVAIGGLWESKVHPDDLPRVLQKVADQAGSATPFADEYRILLPDGRERIIKSYSKRFVDHDGQSRMVGANWDVTDEVLLRRELERAKDLAEARSAALEVARQKIEHSALHDYLTDLPNRRYLDDALRRMMTAGDEKGGLAILHIDLDRFKHINDTLGHATGDSLLTYVAKVLRDCIDPADFVARVGGDEFVIVRHFDGATTELVELSKRLIRELSKPVVCNGNLCRIGASIGIACRQEGEIDAAQLLLNADVALYRAKKNGRNRHEFFSVQSYREIISNKKTADEILAALEQREFIPFYQLQFRADTLEPAGVETLARWATPDGRLLSPDAFLSVAEELGVVAEIDAIMLEAALQDYRGWQRLNLHIPKISVNVSLRRLSDPVLMKNLKTLDFSPGTLSFELLESIFLDQCDEQILQRLADLRDLGIALEIDDFGTGHASIVSLLRTAPEALKIDRELVRGIVDSREQQELLRSIIDIGHSLDICVVAEGVETGAHVRILRDLGCDVLQGYALAKPMRGADLVDFVKRQDWRRA